MAEVLTDLVSRISLDSSDFTAGLDKVILGAGDMDAFLSRVAGSILSPAGIIGAVAAIGTAAFVSAEQYDAAMDTIAARTGATGAVLDELEASFKNVYGSVPSSSAAVADAISAVKSRLDLTGPALEQVSTQFLNLSRLTGVDVTLAIERVTRVFGDWGIETEKQSGTLDFLFRLSQQTGVGIDRLSETMVKFGAPLRQMGFDFEHSAALVGKFEKEGVNTELVMGSLRIALTRMAKEGATDAGAALSDITERIKGAGSAGEANAIALEVFGSRAGPDMAAAIREGRFEIGELVAALELSRSTINAVAKANDDAAENWTTTWHKIQLVLQPAGEGIRRVLNGVASDILSLTKKTDDYTDAVTKSVKALAPAITDGRTMFGVNNDQAMSLSALNIVQAKNAEAVKAATDAILQSTNAKKSATAEAKKSKEQLAEEEKSAKAYEAEVARLTRAMRDWERQKQLNRTALFEMSLKTIEAREVTEGISNYLLTGANAAFGSAREKVQDYADAIDGLIKIAEQTPPAFEQSKAVTDLLTQAQADATAGVVAYAEETASAAEVTTAATSAMVSRWDTFGSEVRGIMTRLGDDINRKLWTGEGSWKEMGISALQSLGQAVTEKFITPFMDAIAEFISTSIVKLLGGEGLGAVSSALDGLGVKVSSIFGGGASAAAGSVTDIAGSAGGAGGGAGSAVGAASSGIWGAIGAIGSVGSMVSGIISNFQNARQEGTLNAIELNTRYAMEYLGNRADQGILGVLFSINEQLSWGPLVKAAESTRDILLSLGASYINPSLDTIKSTALEIRDKIGGIGSVTINVSGGSDSADVIARAVMAELRLQMGVA